jgi:hypothetical protein
MQDYVVTILCRLIAEHGVGVCRDPRSFENLLRDLCAPYRREVSVISRALSERVVAELLARRGSTPRDVMISRLVKRLEENLALTEAAARWAVEAWATALLTDGEPERPVYWYEFKGVGNGQTDNFRLEHGIAVFEADYQGQDGLLIDLFDSQGRYIDLAANVVGASRTVKPVGIYEARDYRLKIRTTGPWVVEVRQPSISGAQPRPYTIDGCGQHASPYINLEGGATRFEMRHAGRSNFTVTLLSSQGSYVELIANEIGACQTSRSLHVDPAGPYLLDILGDGDWQITIE